MLPIRTAETNFNFGPPEGVNDGSIGSLPCLMDRSHEESTYIYSVWELSSEEREAIANGYNVRLGVGWIGAFPPVSLGVTHLQKDEVEREPCDYCKAKGNDWTPECEENKGIDNGG